MTGCRQAKPGLQADEVSRLLNAWFGPEVQRVEVQTGGNCPSCIYTLERSLVDEGVDDQRYVALLLSGRARARILRARLLAAAPSLSHALDRRILIIDSVPGAFKRHDKPLMWFRRVDSLHWQLVPFGE